MGLGQPPSLPAWLSWPEPDWTWNLEPPSGGSGQPGVPSPPAGTVTHQGGRALVTQLVPTRVAPRQQGVNLLSVGKASRTLLPASQFAQGRALQKLKPAGRQAPPALVGSCPGLPSMGRPGRAVGGAECAACAGPATWRPGSLPPPKTHPRPCSGDLLLPGKHVGPPAPPSGWLESRPLSHHL